MDPYREYNSIKTDYNWLLGYYKLVGGSKLSEAELTKILKKHIKKVKKVGLVIWFFKGKPVAADNDMEKATKKMRGIIKKKPEKYQGNLLTRIDFLFMPELVKKKKRGALRVELMVGIATIKKGIPSIAPRDKKNSNIRFFYNRDELPHFKLSEMGEIALAAEAKKFKDTLIGHYQYTEIQELMEDE